MGQVERKLAFALPGRCDLKVSFGCCLNRRSRQWAGGLLSASYLVLLNELAMKLAVLSTREFPDRRDTAVSVGWFQK
jgi:hypothetical protein